MAIRNRVAPILVSLEALTVLTGLLFFFLGQ